MLDLVKICNSIKYATSPPKKQLLQQKHFSEKEKLSSWRVCPKRKCTAVDRTEDKCARLQVEQKKRISYYWSSTIVPMKYNAHEEISRYFFFWVLMQPCCSLTTSVLLQSQKLQKAAACILSPVPWYVYVCTTLHSIKQKGKDRGSLFSFVLSCHCH